MPASRGRRSPMSPAAEPAGVARRCRLRGRAGRLPGSTPGVPSPGLAAASPRICAGRGPVGRRRRRRAGRVPGAPLGSAACVSVAAGAVPSPASGAAALSGVGSAFGDGAATGGRRRRRRRLRSRRIGRAPGASSADASETASPSPAGVTGSLVSGAAGLEPGSPEAAASTGLRRRRRLRRRGAPSCARASGVGSPGALESGSVPPAGVIPAASGKAAAASGRGSLGWCPLASPASDSVGSRAGPSLA
jgi:hypothetical protein